MTQKQPRFPYQLPFALAPPLTLGVQVDYLAIDKMQNKAAHVTRAVTIGLFLSQHPRIRVTQQRKSDGTRPSPF